MWRYIKLYGYFLRFSFSKAMEFRFDFFFRVVMDALFYATHLSLFRIIYLHTDSLGGLNEAQIYVFVSSYFVIDALQMTFTNNNLWILPFSINTGDLDYDLVRPASSLFFVSLREFAANSALNLILAIGIFSWSLSNYQHSLELQGLALPMIDISIFCALLLVGYLIRTCMVIMLLSTVFWTQSTQGIHELFYTVESLGERPHAIYTGWLKKSILSFVPVALICSYPCMVLFEGASFSNVGYMLVIAAIFCGLLKITWSCGLRAYSSASS